MPGFPAARIGDLTAPHMDILLTGSPNVKVNNQPFHTVPGVYFCPIIGIGVTLVGSFTVNVNNFPAGRVTTIGRCLTPTVVVTGSTDTNVG